MRKTIPVTASRHQPRAAEDVAPWSAALLTWLVAGAAALAVFPALRATDAWFGWLPFWLVVAPLLDLLVLRRRRLSADALAWIARWRRHRRRSRRQALPAQRRRARTRRRDRPAATPVGERPGTD